MLNKKYQVLLSKWMENYIKTVAEKYDLNLSSTIRVHMCLGILYVISILEPQYNIDLQNKEILEFANKVSQENRNLSEEQVHHLMSKIIFEARKAVEYRLSKGKREKNNKLSTR